MIGYRSNPERTLRSIRAEIDGPIHGQHHDTNPLPQRQDARSVAIREAAQREAAAYHAWIVAKAAFDQIIANPEKPE